MLFSVPFSASNETSLLAEDESYYHTDSALYMNAPDAVKGMMDIQNENTLSLTKEDYKFQYGYDLIRDKVNGYDFSKHNNFSGENITPEVLLENVIEGIESVEFLIFETYVYTKGTMCGVRETDSIWNSKREYRNKTRTAQHGNSSRCKHCEMIFKLESD